MPIPKQITAIEVALFFDLGNCVHRQLITAMELIENAETGKNTQKVVKNSKLKVKFIIIGESV